MLFNERVIESSIIAKIESYIGEYMFKIKDRHRYVRHFYERKRIFLRTYGG